MEILSMVNLGNLYTEFRKKNFTFCFRNKFLNFWQCHNAKYLKFMCITLDLHTSNLDLHRSRVDVCRSSLDLHTSIPGLSILIIGDRISKLPFFYTIYSSTSIFTFILAIPKILDSLRFNICTCNNAKENRIQIENI